MKQLQIYREMEMENLQPKYDRLKAINTEIMNLLTCGDNSVKNAVKWFDLVKERSSLSKELHWKTKF